MFLKYCWLFVLWNFNLLRLIVVVVHDGMYSYGSLKDQGCDLLRLPDLWWYRGIASWRLIARQSIELSPYTTVRGASCIEEVVDVSNHH